MNTRFLQLEKSTIQSAMPWFAMLVVGTVFFFTEHTFEISQQEGFTDLTEDMLEIATGGNYTRQIAFIVLAAVGVINLIRPSRQEFRPSLPALVVGSAFFSWCLVSILWSEDMAMTVRRQVVMVCCFLGALGLAKQYSPRQLMKLALVLSTAYFIMGVATELVLGTFRPFDPEYRFSGSLHPNMQSTNLVIICLAAFCLGREQRNHKAWWIALFCVAAAFLVLTKSRTGLAGMIVSVAVLWTASTPWRTKLIGGGGMVWAIGTTMLVLAVLGADPIANMTEAALMGRTEDVSSLTSRTPLWKELSTYALEHPVIGYGFETFWTPTRIERVSDVVDWGVRESHSRYLDTVLSLGLVGLILMMATTCAGLYLAAKLFRQTDEPGYAFIVGLLVFGLVDGLTESGLVNPLFATFLSAAAVMSVVWHGGEALNLSHVAPMTFEPTDMEYQVAGRQF